MRIVLSAAFLFSLCFVEVGLLNRTARAEEGAPGSLQSDGRILSYPRPDNLNHPSRWRYFPPERIVEGNVFKRFLISSFISPILFRDSDVGTGGGIALTDIDFREQRRQEFAGIFLSYTTEGQQNYSFVWRRWLERLELPNGGVLQEERSHFTLRGGYRRTLTRRFFGFGDETQEEDESSYTDETFFIAAHLQRSIPEPGDNLVLDGGVRLETHRLFGGQVSGVPDTKVAFSEDFADADTRDLLWLNFGVRWDTRDSQVNPYRGWALGSNMSQAVLQNGGGFGGVYGAFATVVLPVPALAYAAKFSGEENPPTDTLALIAEVQTSEGELPFFARPSLGGSDRQRGYIGNRWTGDSLWFAAAEHRIWLLPRGFRIDERIRIERVGVATFYELGSVASSLGDLAPASVKQSYGLGLRFTLERSAPFRVDLGFSEEDVNLSFRFGLSF